MNSGRRLLIVLAWLVGLLGTAPEPALGQAEGDGTWLLTTAAFLPGDAAAPPPDHAAWRPQSLPDLWTLTHPAASDHGWYRLVLVLPRAPDGAWALMAARLRTVGAVHVNGQLVGQAGVFGQAEPGPAPAFFLLPPGLLHEGANTLHVHLWAPPDWAGALSPLRVGPQAAVARAWARERMLRVTSTEVACILSLTLGLVMLAIWAQRRRESMFGCVGLAALAMGLWLLTDLGWLPLPRPWAEWMGMVGGYVKGAALFVYVLRFAGWRWPRVERALWLGTAAVLLAAAVEIFILRAYWFPEALWHSWMLPTLGALAVILRVAWQRRDWESALLLAGHLYSVAASVWATLKPPFDGFDPLPSHLVPLLLVIAWILTRRFVQSLREAEALNAGLERRVALKHAELALSYERMRAMTRDTAIAEERSRLMRDMHDGIGAQLITALSLVEHGGAEPGHVAAVLRECIDDLRLTIDSLEPTDGDLLPVLGNLRYRLESRLRQQGVQLEWALHQLPPLPGLTPRGVLQVLRILQEALTNVLKHARASRIQVDARLDDGGHRVAIRVCDNGTGFR